VDNRIQDNMHFSHYRSSYCDLLNCLALLGLLVVLCFTTMTVQAQTNRSAKKTKGKVTIKDLKVLKVNVQGLERPMGVFCPDVEVAAERLPLVLVLHGGNGNYRNFAKKTNWMMLARKERFIVAFLQAQEVCLVRDGISETSNRWMTDLKKQYLCPSHTFVDDVIYIDAAIIAISKAFKVDTKRLYVAGFSNGMGYILQNLITQKSSVFAAMGGVGMMSPMPYTGHVEMPVMMIIGQKDSRMTARSGITEFAMDDQNSIFDDPTHKTCLKHLTDYLQVGKDYDWSKADRKLTIDFYPNMENSQSYLKYIMIENLQHRFPNGKKIGRELDGAVLLWDFFKGYEKGRKNGLDGH